jgi:hypothetical protein
MPANRNPLSTVDFALPRTTACLHVEEVVVEAVIVGRVGRGALFAVPEETQRGQGPFDRFGRGHPAVLDRDRIRGQRKTRRRNARRPVGRGLVDHQAVRGIGFMLEISECALLQMPELVNLIGRM